MKRSPPLTKLEKAHMQQRRPNATKERKERKRERKRERERKKERKKERKRKEL